ncbi:hypothetical protein [Marinobacterium weihaiense]|uniref:Membrane protein affecting hemolysin expression n=1 Tax=Marinobacterium weihaiense TaxID=2851016 RepID=A0ABS6M844_9GAMM|nr:hypothetical protein [Marinobacterium weihaiense]MBV0932427.1 hypothetical protein [Marinobacterium weihaiense]
MEPTDDTVSCTPVLPLRTLISVLLILLLGLAMGGALEYLRLQTRAAEQAAEISRGLGRSSAILIQPLVLSDDRISLNYLLNELVDQPLINGLRLSTPDQTLIALAGSQQGRTHTLELVQGEMPIGRLTLWSNPAPLRAALQQQLLEIALLVMLCLGIAAVLLSLSLRRQRDLAAAAVAAPAPNTADRPAPPFSLPQDSDSIPDFNFSALPPEPASPPAPAETGRYAAPTASRSRPVTPAPQADSAPASPPIDEPPTPPAEPQPEQPPVPDITPAPLAERTPDADSRSPLDADDLVSLLKPAPDHHQVPRFTPRSADQDESDAALVPDLDELTFSQPDVPPDEPSPTEWTNPLSLVEPDAGGLYTLEQELELTLTPEDAGYLLLIDTRSAHSDNVDEEEREHLLRNYRTLAASAARIYNGDIETLRNGDLQIRFCHSDDKDSHGINALCCAMLFTWLYTQYNQQQIRAFQPVMNLHMALVRGPREGIERMQEEAAFLTRTTQSNALISHTAVTEAPLLKANPLEQADIRREDEDKVLILSISPSYQALLEKQADHLMQKLNERERGSA